MCICNYHGYCIGLIMEEEMLKNFCSCNCHNNSYQLIRNSIAFNNIESARSNDLNQNIDY